MRRRPIDTPEVRAAVLAARWAQRIGLKPGNLWEPAVARNILAEYQQLVPVGEPTDESAWALVEALGCRRLGLEVRS